MDKLSILFGDKECEMVVSGRYQSQFGDNVMNNTFIERLHNINAHPPKCTSAIVNIAIINTIQPIVSHIHSGQQQATQFVISLNNAS